MLLNGQVMVEAYRRDASSKDQLISELKSTKKRLLAEVKDLKQELLSAQGEKQKAELEQARLQTEVARVQEQMNNMEAHLQAIQTERDQLETQIQVPLFKSFFFFFFLKEIFGLFKVYFVVKEKYLLSPPYSVPAVRSEPAHRRDSGE